ncbi:hypothetical protein EK21DRAFT_113768 [Setomelanomma holmii]|uniref:F-box domain-containing protein n=1 Tax=Setomelanomma holmii TaxID=210430 RepID=A0A9P4H6J6_9PLEO|nr:hypothetical protein EK21DRAFT_113768 [Setomelanomma holmii]
MTRLKDLPPELVRNTFAYIRVKCDKQQLCLVNRKLRDLIVPELWSHLESEFCCEDTEMINTIIKANKNVLVHVRRVTIDRCSDMTTMAEEQRHVLTLFLTALPRDKSDAVYMFDHLDSDMIQTLFQEHRELKAVSLYLQQDILIPAAVVPYLTQVNDIAGWLVKDAVHMVKVF